jgi:hypothetical protein
VETTSVKIGPEKIVEVPDNKIYKVTVPIYLSLPRKTKRDRTLSCNLNTYRNTHYHVLNEFKKRFYDELKFELRKLPVLETPIFIEYTVYLKSNRGDIMNIGSVVDKFFCDALQGKEDQLHQTRKDAKIDDDTYDKVIGASFFCGGIDKAYPRCEVTIYEVGDAV